MIYPMHYSMTRTSVVLDEGLLDQARKRAALGGQTLNEFIDRALRDLLAKQSATKTSPFRTMTLGASDPRVELSMSALKRSLDSKTE